MSGATWVATFKVTLHDACDHDEENASECVKELINEEGLFGLCDMSDFELLSLDPLPEP